MSLKGFYGFFGFNNLGDELIFEYVRSKYPNAFFFSLKEDKKRNIYKRSDIISLLRCEKIIFPGGNIIQDKSSFKSFYFYIFLILILQIFNKKIYLINNGIGPVSTRFRTMLVKYILKRSELVSLRTVKDYEKYKKICNKIIRGADTVFLFDVKDRNKGNKKGVVFKSSYFKKIIKIPEDHILIAFSPEDELFIKDNYREYKYISMYSKNLEECVKILSDFEYLYAFPFHGIILGYISGVKYIFSYPYDEKVKNLILDLDGEINILDKYEIFCSSDNYLENRQNKIKIFKEYALKGFENI